jgi:1-acyl-sn-glycerol-3-phosphate acyltransferase
MTTGRQSPEMRWFYFVSRFVSWVFCKVWLRVRVHGAENVPADGPLVLAGNHASYLDPLLMGTSTSRRVWYVARASLDKLPLAGLWMRAVGIIFIDRKAPGREGMGRVIDSLLAGEAVGMFPEGTRTSDGRVQEFQRGLLLLLKKSQARVVPVGVRGSFTALPRGTFLPKPHRCAVHFGRPRTAEEVLAPGGLEALRHEVAALSAAELVGPAGESGSV